MLILHGKKFLIPLKSSKFCAIKYAAYERCFSVRSLFLAIGATIKIQMFSVTNFSRQNLFLLLLVLFFFTINSVKILGNIIFVYFFLCGVSSWISNGKSP